MTTESSTQQGRHPSIALYIAGALVQIAGLAAVSFQVEEWNFALFTIGLTIAGTTASFLMRRIGIKTNIIKWGAVLLTLVFIASMRRSELFSILVPSESMLTQEVVLVCALAVTATFGSFLLLTDESLGFTCVWSIALIGLTGTVNVNRELPICFAGFLLGSAFLLVHQNALWIGATAGSGIDSDKSQYITVGDRWRLLRSQFGTSFAAWGFALILGSLVAIPLQMIGRNMSLNAILQQLRAPVGAPTHPGVQRLGFNNLDEFTVGLGPVEDDSSLQLSVLSDSPHYWRGRTYDFYDGHGWSNSTAQHGTQLKPESPKADANGSNTFKIDGPDPVLVDPTLTHEVVTDFHAISFVRSPFYHAAEPVLLRAPVSYVYEHLDRTLGSRDMDGSDYQVVSAVSTARPSALRRSGTKYPQEIIGRYLVTTQMDDTTQALAQQAVEGAPDNPYDRASAIKRFISGRCVYNVNARAVPHDRDAVDFFLNESREGYCDLYATAMVALCRCAGIPARVATGYAPGTRAINDGTDGPPTPKGEKRLRYILHGNDLHAWAEVYFAHYGWIVFDATDESAGITPQARATPASKRPPPTPFQRLAVGAFALAAAALLFVAGNEWRLRWGVRLGLPHWHLGAASREANRAYRTAVRLLARRGVRRLPTMTIGEFAHLVGERLGPEASRAFREIGTLEERLIYAPSSLTAPNSHDAAEAEQIRAALRALRIALKSRPTTKRTA